MSEHDPFAYLGELIDQPVAPNPRFAADLKAQLMSGLTASSRSRQEEIYSMEATLRLPGTFQPESDHRFRPMALLGIAAMIVVVVGIAALWATGRFDSDPGSPTIIPAVSLQDSTEGTPVSVASPATTSIVLNDEQDVFAGWEMDLAADESIDYGGMAGVDGTVYRLLATPSFVGVEAVDGPAATNLWRVARTWSNYGVVADDKGVYFFSGPSQITALDPESGDELWTVGWEDDRNAVSLALNDGVLYVWDTSGSLAALEPATGVIIWVTSTNDDSSNQVSGSETITPIAVGGWVAVVTGAGNLTVFDRDTGEIVHTVPGFDPVHSRLAGQPTMVFVLGGDPEPGPDGANLHGSGMDVETGEIVWELEITGPLISPVATNELNFYFIADDVAAGVGAAVGTPVVISDDSAPWSGETPAELTGGEWVFGIDALTGEVIWQQITRADGFAGLVTIFPNSGALSAYTSDGHFVGMARDYGAIARDPRDLDQALLDVISGGSTEGGYFATTLDGDLLWFGGIPADQQG